MCTKLVLKTDEVHERPHRVLIHMTHEQDIGLRESQHRRPRPQPQLNALEAAGCDDIYTDHASGAATARPQLDALLRNAREGDTLLAWPLDRLGATGHRVHDSRLMGGPLMLWW